jgi:hypothetical protein
VASAVGIRALSENPGGSFFKTLCIVRVIV